MLVSEVASVEEFTDETMKGAYLKACKWLSTNVIAVNNSEYITFKIVKCESKFGENKVKLFIYVTEEEETILQHNCNICKELNGKFYLNENKYMCYTCRIQPYRERIKEKLKRIKEGLRGRIYL